MPATPRSVLEPDEVSMPVLRESDVPHVVAAAQRFCLSAGASRLQSAMVATAASELANNLWMHATRGGRIVLRRLRGALRQGIELQSIDHGPGMADVELAMKEGYSTGGGMGCGLPGAKRLMDEFELQSRLGVGTQVRAVKWIERAVPEAPLHP